MSPPRVGSAVRTRSEPSPATPGSSRPAAARPAGSASPRTHAPSGVMPMGTTSYFSGSRLRRMLPAEMQETECSLLRPPKTTATRVRGVLTCRTVPGGDLRVSSESYAGGTGHPAMSPRAPVSLTGGSPPSVEGRLLQRRVEIGEQIRGVLDSARQPDESLRHRIAPACATIRCRVDTAEARGGCDERGRADEAVHLVAPVQPEGEQGADSAHLAGRH